MTVSVVIPAYKASRFIRGTLASVFAQTRLPDEVIVVDDRSPDDTAAVVEAAATTAPVPVRVIRLANNSGGPAHPLNVGISAARGELIATLDHDDRLDPDYLTAKLPVLAREATVGAVLAKVDRVRGDEVLTERRAETDAMFAAAPMRVLAGLPAAAVLPAEVGYNLLVAHTGFCISASNLVFPKAVWAAVGGFDPRFRVTVDYHFLTKLLLRYDLGFVDRYLVRWQLSATSLSNAFETNRSHEEEMFVIGRSLRTDRFAPSVRREYRRCHAGYALGAAYTLRGRRRYWDAARAYIAACRHPDSVRGGALGLLKLPFYAAWRGTRGGVA